MGRGRVTPGSAPVGATSPAPSLPAAHAQVATALIFLPIFVSCALACVQQAVLVTPMVSILSACGPRGDPAAFWGGGCVPPGCTDAEP